MAKSSERRQEILSLLATGKITVDEATKLLSEKNDDAPPTSSETTSEVESIKIMKEDEKDLVVNEKKIEGPNWLRVRVKDLHTGKNKVSVNIPMGLVKFGLSMGKRYSPELNDLDLTELEHYIETENGLLVDVQDEEDGEHVQIYFD